MKSPKQMSAEELAHAGRIGDLLRTTVRNTGQSSDPNRKAAADWWENHLNGVVRQHFQQAER